MAGTPLEAPRVAGRRQFRVRAVVLDQRSALLGVLLLEQAADRDVDLLGIAEESFAVRRRELERLDVAVPELERPRSERGDVVALEDVERHRHERALPQRATRVDADAAV